MKRALALAARGEGLVEPNPMVGCVLVKGDKVIGEGFHAKHGGPHAEVVALEAAGKDAKGATAYVTLEPCSHYGKTPPCANALVAAKVKRVVVGYLDPTPMRTGEGIGILEDAGIAVEMGPRRNEAAELIAPFHKTVTDVLPYVIAKWASTVDGAIATRTGHSQWISNEQSRKEVHKTRARVDAIVVGINTVLADDPTLTARGVRKRRVARRIVIDPDLQIPVDCNLVKTAGEAPLTLAVSNAMLLTRYPRKMEALEDAGVEVVGLSTYKDTGAMDLRPLLRRLVRTHHATNVLLEGGGHTIGSFLEQGLVDELMVFIGPKLLGDPAHLPPVAMPGKRGHVERVDQAARLRLKHVKQLGNDVMLRYGVLAQR